MPLLSEIKDALILQNIIRAQAHTLEQMAHCNSMLLKECVFWRADAHNRVYHTESLQLGDLIKAKRFLDYEPEHEVLARFGVTL